MVKVWIMWNVGKYGPPAISGSVYGGCGVKWIIGQMEEGCMAWYGMGWGKCNME